MKIISVIGYSQSGKTTLILKVISFLKERFGYESAVIKNIHEHQIDKKGKDSYLYTQSGANYSITKNINSETTIFIKRELSIQRLIAWLNKGPFKIDLVITEGFRSLEVPTILCLKEKKELERQLNKNVIMISGRICELFSIKGLNLEIPIVDIQKQPEKFLKIFNLSP